MTGTRRDPLSRAYDPEDEVDLAAVAGVVGVSDFLQPAYSRLRDG